MRHSIPVEELGPRGAAMAAAVDSCVHCGFCLPTCPTYVEMGEEMDSPRGRIVMIKEELEGNLEAELVMPYVDNCLGCLACVTACPSGVEYGDLIASYRADIEARRVRTRFERLRRAAVVRILTSPRVFRPTTRLAAAGRRLGRVLPGQLRAMVELAPAHLPPPQPLPEVTPAVGARRHRVLLLAGCVQQALAPEINRATLAVLARNGIETVVPGGQGCCGSLAMHTGMDKPAKRHARRNLRAFGGVDAVLTTAAGCGSGMREYGLLFAGEVEQVAAETLADRTVDISAFLADVGLTAPLPELTAPLRLAYQDACHLAHAQGERTAPRTLLEAIPGARLVEPAEPEICCGSAGIYNIERPQVSRALGARKVRNLLAAEPDLVVSGNVGCLIQLRVHLGSLDSTCRALHTMEILDLAYRESLRA